VPIADHVIDESQATAISLPTTRGLSPRVGHGYLIYRAPKPGTDGLWKLADGGVKTELWNGLDGRALSGPAIAPDGQRLAFLVQRQGRTQLYLTNADGSGARRVAETLEVRGTPAWSPDGRGWRSPQSGWRAASIQDPGRGGTPILLVNEYSIDPTWSPSGKFLVYSGADVGTTSP
jgi:Periplasmic component of the Tol biopolymer transport system